MRLAMRLPSKKGDGGSEGGVDPRSRESAEIIDLASRAAFPAVTDRRAKGDGLGLAAGVAVVGLLGAVTFWAMNSARLPDQQAGVTTGGVAPAAAPVVMQPAVAPTPVVAPVPGTPLPDPAPAPVLVNNPGIAAGPATNPYASPTLAFDFSRAAGSGPRLAEAPIPAPGAPNTAASGGNSSAAAFATSIGGVGGGPASARAMANPSTTVTEGTLIPAILETAINTDVPGYVRAVVSQDVRSFDGKRVLVPRSSRLIGQYQAGVQQGQKRAYVIWTRLIRPDGVSVSLASPAIGFDGTTGLEGDVNSHFFQRFGSGLLLSVVGGLSSVATGGVGGLILGSGAQNAATSAVQQNGQISPTIKVRMGEPIRVFTARDLDFSTVAK